MKERPILFQPEMVKAILDDRKTQTRRVVKPQPEGSSYWTQYYDSGCFYPNNYAAIPAVIKCPYGVPGDRLWVREKWRIFDAWEECGCSEDCSCARHDGKVLFYADILCDESKWKPSIHMPRKYSRLTLEITNVRVERVQDTIYGDMIAEGLPIIPSRTLFSRFADLWDKMHKKRGFGWSENPFCWVIEFKKVSPLNQVSGGLNDRMTAEK